MDSSRPPIVVIAGPTGVGKTALSLALAETFRAEIVNADSMQVYRYMDIGTAKPTMDERARAPHHLIDIVDPDQHFDAAEYLQAARPLIDRLHRDGTRAVVVGGTGFYLRSLLKGLFEGPGRDPALREKLRAEADALGRRALHQRLCQVDPESGKRIHENDLVRIIRALEVYELTGRPISDFQREHRLAERPYRTLFFCLDLPREELYQRIDARAEQMFDLGLAGEVRGLMERGYGPELGPMRAIGYKEAAAYVLGKMTREEAVRQTARDTRRYAKRQLTWYRAQDEAVWLSPRDVETALGLAEAFWGGLS